MYLPSFGPHLMPQSTTGGPNAAILGLQQRRSAFSAKARLPPCCTARVAFVVIVIMCISSTHGAPIGKSPATSTGSSRKGRDASKPAQHLPSVTLCEYVISSPSESKAQRVNLYHNSHSSIPTQPGTSRTRFALHAKNRTLLILSLFQFCPLLHFVCLI